MLACIQIPSHTGQYLSNNIVMITGIVNVDGFLNNIFGQRMINSFWETSNPKLASLI